MSKSSKKGGIKTDINLTKDQTAAAQANLPTEENEWIGFNMPDPAEIKKSQEKSIKTDVSKTPNKNTSQAEENTTIGDNDDFNLKNLRDPNF